MVLLDHGTVIVLCMYCIHIYVESQYEIKGCVCEKFLKHSVYVNTYGGVNNRGSTVYIYFGISLPD